jgi:PAS domain S-box-containing protein
MAAHDPIPGSDVGDRSYPSPPSTPQMSRTDQDREGDCQLSLSGLQLSTFVEQALDAIVVANTEGQYVDANAAACILFDLSKEELLKHRVADFTESSVQFEGLWQNFLQTQHLTGEFRLVRLDGTILDVEYAATANVLPNCHISVLRDITDRKRLELELQQSEAKLSDILTNTLASITSFRLFADYSWTYEYFSPGCEIIFGYRQDELMADPTLWWSRISSDDQRSVILAGWNEIIAGRSVRIEYQFHHKAGSLRWIASALTSRWDEANQCWIVTAIDTDISERKQAELAMQQAMEREQQIRERERFIANIAQNIRQSLNLNQILTTTVSDVRQFLQVNRVVIYRFDSDWSGNVIAESIDSPEYSIVHQKVRDTCFEASMANPYRGGHIHTVNDVHTAELDPCYVDLLTTLQVRAALVIPIVVRQELWGLLAAHQCTGPRQWQQISWHLLQQLSIQLAIGIQQAQLYQEVQQFNNDLERQVQVRTAQLQQALEFEALLKRITDKVRDSLDENQILQTVVDELGQGLGVDCCNTGIYDSHYVTSTITHEYAIAALAIRGEVASLTDNPPLYKQLLKGQYCHCCLIVAEAGRLNRRFAILCCPIFDDQGTLGDLWLMKPRDQLFSDLEIRLVQQVANQCAIAIRQARLYETAQAEVEALERLNQLKDDFLSTVSHELRTPMANVKMAIQMLEIHLGRLNLLTPDSGAVGQYFRILQSESDREITLINDLLDLSRLDLSTEPLALECIDLQTWIPRVAKPFFERAQSQNQQFQIHLIPDLPLLTTNASYLERILAELLTNACKYTLAYEQITLSVAVQPPTSTLPTSEPQSPLLLLHISNTGVEIPKAERDRIFEKFYRIPNQDPWKHGGTGLGLALVKKLAQCLGGDVELTSHAGITTFTLQLPITSA